jgi:oxygen-dependent protoporphyrinogen oxidase
VRIVVVGGGITGLAAALRLRERAGDAADIVLIERSDRLGGKLRTVPFAGQPVETGAETFLMREHGADSAVLDLVRRVGLGDDVINPAPAGAAIAVGGELRAIPAGTLLGIPTTSSNLDGLATIADSDVDEGRPLLARGEDIAVGRLVRQRFGYDVVNQLVEPLLGGVYAGRADRLSLAATVPGLFQTAQRENTLDAAVRAAIAASGRVPGAPVFGTVRGGLSRLVDAIAAAANVRILYGDPVRELARTVGLDSVRSAASRRGGRNPAVGLDSVRSAASRRGGRNLAVERWRLVAGSTREPRELIADAVVLAVPAFPARRLLGGVDEAAAHEVAALDYASVALVTMALPAATELPELSGFLVPPAADRVVKAATFFTTKWPELRGDAGPVLVRASLGRYCDERVLQRTDDDLVALARHDLDELLGTPLPDPLAVRVNRWGGALPQYGVGHVDRVARARAALPASLALAGAAYDGVGIAACVRSGQTAADAVAASLGG